jgi:elongation factor 2
MDLKHNIRSMSVIAHVDHGKTTLTDSLVQKAGIISAKAAGGARYTDTRADEAERGITIKSTGISMFFEYKAEDGVFGLTKEDLAERARQIQDKKDAEANVQITENSYLINLIDSPGHVDFSSEVTAALRVTDGALVVVDTTRLVSRPTVFVRLSPNVPPVLMVNRSTVLFLSCSFLPEPPGLCRSIETVNVVVATYNDEALGDVQVSPTKGTVAFGSGLHQWAFTLKRFAKDYGAKFGVPEEKMAEKLWGDWYFDAGRKVWTTTDKNGTLERAFCQFIATPNYQSFRSHYGREARKGQEDA